LRRAIRSRPSRSAGIRRVAQAFGLIARCVEQRGQFLKRIDSIFIEENRLPFEGRDRIGYQKLRIVALVPVHHRPDAPQARTDRVSWVSSDSECLDIPRWLSAFVP